MQKRFWGFLFLMLFLMGSTTALAAADSTGADTLPVSRSHAAYLSGGTGDLPLFSPSAELTRAEAVRMLALLAESTEAFRPQDGALASLEPVPLEALQSGPSGTDPGGSLTRAEFARYLAHFFALRDNAVPFGDVPETHPDADAILSLRARGWVQGDENNRFRPDDAITRIEAAVILNRALNRTPDRDYIDRSRPAYYRDVTPANWYYYEVMEAVVPHGCQSANGAERWTSHAAPAPAPTEGFYLIDNHLYYYDSARQDILRNETRGVLSFSASGQCTTGKARLDAKMLTIAANGMPSLAEMQEQMNAELARASEWNLILVNGSNPLPDDFTIPELTVLDSGYSIDSRVYPALQKMLADARAAGYHPLVCSAYRSWDKQAYLHRRRMNSYLQRGYSQEKASDAAAFWVAKPGTSEHQAGLAADIVDAAYPTLNKSQENRPVQKWLMAHCAEYGFILRYPTNKSDLTGVGYEPWHYRYVGVEAAQEIMASGICLEEYLGG